MTGARGWVLVAGVVIAIDATARPGHTLSEAADRAIAAHPVLTVGAATLVWAHVCNLIPPAVDPVHRLAVLIARKAS